MDDTPVRHYALTDKQARRLIDYLSASLAGNRERLARTTNPDVVPILEEGIEALDAWISALRTPHAAPANCLRDAR